MSFLPPGCLNVMAIDIGGDGRATVTVLSDLRTLLETGTALPG